MSEFTVDLDGRGPVTEPIATDTPTISTRDAVAAVCVAVGLATLTVALGIGIAWWIGCAVLGVLLLCLGLVLAYEPADRFAMTPVSEDNPKLTIARLPGEQ